MNTLLPSLRAWPASRWWTAVAIAALTIVVVAVPTDLIDTGWFSREVPPTWWSWPTLLIVAVLSGLVTATYVAYPAAALPRRSESRWGILGGALSFFAVGCPVCNKIVLIALGSAGAMRYFQPVQPVLAVASIAALGWALSTRLRREFSCPATLSEATFTAQVADSGVDRSL